MPQTMQTTIVHDRLAPFYRSRVASCSSVSVSVEGFRISSSWISPYTLLPSCSPAVDVDTTSSYHPFVTQVVVHYSLPPYPFHRPAHRNCHCPF